MTLSGISRGLHPEIALHDPAWKEQLWRILDLLFANPHVTPTLDEYGMFLAYAASLRSGDLSRQVGAVVVSHEGNVLATGANDVPKNGGGLYCGRTPSVAHKVLTNGTLGADSTRTKRSATKW